MDQFQYFFAVGLKRDEDGKIIERQIEQRSDTENLDICGGWLRNSLGFDEVYYYGGTALRWAGEKGKFEVYEGNS